MLTIAVGPQDAESSVTDLRGWGTARRESHPARCCPHRQNFQAEESSKMRRIFAVTGLAAALFITCLTACQSSSSTAASSASAAVVTAWCDGVGHSDEDAASSDYSDYGTDDLNHDILAAEADGARLASDAQTAENDPYPGDPGGYITAMSDTAAAGTDASEGDFADANAEFSDSIAAFNSMFAVIGINNCVAKNLAP
jgi:hypothetical protein